MSLTAALLVLLSAVLHPLWNALVKGGVSPEGMYVSMAALFALFGAAHGVAAGADFFALQGVWPLLILSSAGQIFYGMGLIVTLREGDLSLYYPVVRASPVFIVAVSVILLGETYSIHVLAGIALVLVGLFILQGRGFDRLLANWRPLAGAVLAMLSSGVYAITDAFIVREIHPAVLLFWTQVFCAPVFLLIFRRSIAGPITPRSWLGAAPRHLAAGIASYLSYYLILAAYQLGADAAAVTSVRQAAIPISVLFGALLLKEPELRRRMAGSVIIAVGIALIILLR